MDRTDPPISRRTLLAMAAAGAALPLAGCSDPDWYGKNVTGVLPDLDFELTRAADGATVTEADYRGQVVAMFFGFTFCPDICPSTLANLTAVADELGERAGALSVLFVTVDPERDTPEALAGYVDSFTGRAAGLRGTDNQLDRLTRRLRVTYKVAPHEPGDRSYSVSHGKSVYIFDGEGSARLLWPEFDKPSADIAAATADMRRLMAA